MSQAGPFPPPQWPYGYTPSYLEWDAAWAGVLRNISAGAAAGDIAVFLDTTGFNIGAASFSISGIVTSFPTIAALRALTAGLFNPTQIYVSGYYGNADGGEGPFTLGAAATDNGGTVINDASGRSWHRDTGGLPLSVKSFGAKGDGVTDDTAAILAACTARGQGEVWFPPGTYNYTALTVPSGVMLRFEGIIGCVLSCTLATGTITLGTGCEISDVTILATAARTTGVPMVSMQGNNMALQRCQMVGYYLGVQVGTFSSLLAIDVRLEACSFRNPAVGAGSGAVYLQNYGNAIISQMVATGPTSGQQPDFGIRFDNGDTLVLSDSNITHHGNALLSETPAGQNAFATQASNSLFDSPGTISGSGNASGFACIGAGNVEDAQFSNCWFGLSAGASGVFLNPAGAGTVQGVDFTGCKFVGNAINGMTANGAGVSNITVTGGDSADNAGGAGLNFEGGCTAFTVTGHRAGNTDSRGPNLYGIATSGAGNNYMITGCNLHGNTTAALSDGATGSNKLVASNLT